MILLARLVFLLTFPSSRYGTLGFFCKMTGIFKSSIGKVGLTLSYIGTITGTRGFFSGSLGVFSFWIYGVTLNTVSGAFGTRGLRYYWSYVN